MSSLNPLILSNVFALHNTSDISWYRFQERDPSSARDELNNSNSNNGRYSPGTATNDPVLHCFLYCLHANYPACWRYVVHEDSTTNPNINSTSTNAHSNTITSTATSSINANNIQKPRCTRELWVFSYNPGGAFNMHVGKPLDEKDPDLAHNFESVIHFLSSKLSVASNGTWNARSRTTPLQVTKMLYLALHNLIEKVMHQNSFLRIGECFVKRIKGEQRKNSIEAGLLGCSFTFFLTGDTLCFHVRVERVKLRNLLHSDLTTKEKVIVFTSPNSLMGTLIGGRFLDDSTSPASTGVLKEWSNIFHLRPALKSDDSYSHNDKFLSSTAIVKVAFGNRQGFEMDFPAECVFRVTGDLRKDPTQILRTMYRRSLGLEVPKLKNMSYPDAAGFALLADHQWSEEEDDPNRHMQVDFWTYSSPFQYHTIQTVYQQRQQYLLQQQQQQQQLLLQKQQKVVDLRSPATNTKSYTPQQTPSASPMPSPGPTHQDGDPTSPILIDKDTGTQSENTESETATSQAEGKKKRAAAPPKRKREPAQGRPPKKPKNKAQSPAATPPPPAPEKKKPAAKKPKKAAAATTAGKGKRGKANQETIAAPQLSQSSESTESNNIQLSSSLPMMMTPNVTNPLPTAEAFADAFDLSTTRRSADEDMDELGGDIDISEWLNSASTAPASGVAQSALSPSGGDFDKEMDFFSSPATTPALAAQKTPAMSPSKFPVMDDTVEIHFTSSKAYPVVAQPQYTPTNPNPTPSPQSPSPVSPSPISSPNIAHSTNSLSNSQDTGSGSTTTPHTPQMAPPPPSFLSASHDSYLPLALANQRKNQNLEQKRPRRFHTFLCAKSYQPLGEGDLPAVSPRHMYSYTPQSKGPPLLDAISYTPEPFPVVPSISTPSTPTSAIPTPLTNLTPNSVFTPTLFPNKALSDRKSGPPFEEDESDSESEESSDEEREVKNENLQELTLTTNPKPNKVDDTPLRIPDSLQYLKMWKVFREQNSAVAAAASSGSAAFSSLLPWDPMPDCLKCDSRSNPSDGLQDSLVANAKLEAWRLCHEKNAFLASNPDLCYVLEQLALSAYNAIPREGHRGAFSRLSLSICVGSLLNCQNAKGGFCVCDDHYELIEEGLQYYPFQSPHSPITYAADPASVGRMLFSLTPVFESLFGEKTIQGPLDLKHWFGSDSDTIFEAQESAPLLISYKDAWVAAPPDNCMRLWDKAQMEPYSSRKNLTYYVLCPQNATMSAAAASFFSDLSCVYEANHLGRHAAQNHYTEYPQGLIFVNAIPTPPTPAPAATPSESEETNPSSATSASRSAAFRDHREAYREACWRLGSHLRTWEQQYNENMNTVVYVIDPFTNTLESGAGNPAHEDNGQFMVRALADILAAQSKSSRRSTVLQIVPASELFLPTSDQSIALRELAFSVFTKIRRLSFTVPISPSSSLRSQLSPNPNPLGSPPLLSPPTPSTTTGQPSPSSAQRQEQQLYEPAFVLSNPPPLFSPGENVLHCCYIPADDLSCTACCVTDAKGELLETKLFSTLPTTNFTPTQKTDPSLPSIQITPDNNNGTNNPNLHELILKFCISCIEWTSRNDWTIVISKLGILTFKEIEEWESFLNDVKPTLFKPNDTGNLVTNVVLGCTHFNPRLQLLSITNPTDISSTSNEPITGSTVEALASSGTTSYLVFPPRPVSHYSHHMIASECAIPLATSYVVTEAASEKGAAPGAFTPRSADSDNRGDKWPKTYMVYLFGLYTKTRNLSALEHNRPSPTPIPPTQTKQRVQQTQEIHTLIRGMTRQYVALSWLNVTPLFPSRLSTLPHHCAIAFRLARLVAIVDSREDKEEKETTTPPLVQSFPTSPAPTTPSHTPHTPSHTPHTPSHGPPPSPHVSSTAFHTPAVPYMFPLTSDT